MNQAKRQSVPPLRRSSLYYITYKESVHPRHFYFIYKHHTHFRDRYQLNYRYVHKVGARQLMHVITVWPGRWTFNV
ncbi:hypothetical protein BGY98DRAFT_965945, partial [Russula aff. rugulosa BPL654]